MGLFERFLSLWVALAIAAGLILGTSLTATIGFIAKLEFAQVNIPIAILIWVMIYPMMVQVNFSAIKEAGKKPKGLALTLVINWLIKPFSMAFIGWLFFKIVFAPFVDPQTASEYIAGMILLGVAPCTAMVFVWSHLTKGDANYTLVQVSVNDIIMVFAFAPIAGYLLGMSDVTVPWNTLFLSVALYVITPLVAGIITRKALKENENSISGLTQKLKPFSIIGLLGTVTLLFAFQAETILAQPQDILLIAIPLLIQTYGIFALAYWFALKLKLPHTIAAPACMIGTSNFFELAVAVAIALFGLNSGASLATVVGVLVEVPVMLTLVAFANRTRHWFIQHPE
ncbi:MAG TPA: arsenical-resistance protein [Gammaproteobacteria bacterium]|nr:arsenical-resistance protein [Gammaproteobacteria bacterium]HCK91892.1 arsenical-resistance protein [Gammaproteobacteria bacterium]|tara:strand:- start:1136 stop:2158 length:1023 start_codon:yes stop_codon:yes gene_type:complete